MSRWQRLLRWFRRENHPDSHERELRRAESRLKAIEDRISLSDLLPKDPHR